MDALRLPLRRGLTRRLAHLAPATVLALGLTLASAGSVHADHGGDHVQGSNNDGGTDITAEQDGSSQEGGNTGGTGGTGPVSTTPTRWTQERLVPFCMQSSLGQNEDVLCNGMVSSCQEEGALRWRVYTRLMSPTGQPLTDWTYQGTRCEGGDAEPGVQTPDLTTADVMEQARAVAPVPGFTVEPEGTTYVNVPTNFAADDDTPVTVSVFPLGIEVPVTFTPSEYSWDFGDGGTGSGAGVRDAAVGAPGAVEHLYERSGDYAVVLTRTYTVSFTLPGGGQVTVPGQVSQDSEPYPLQVGEVQSVVSAVR